MPISAEITVNGAAGSNDDVPINASVQLANNSDTGVASWLWAIAEQPDGSADALTSTTIAAPQFTPRKEGTYLLHLQVQDVAGNVETDQVAVAVRQLKTRARIPAPTETIEVSGSEGWHPALAAQLQELDNVRADPGLFVGQLGTTGMSAGQVCRVSGTATIKSGLPGQEQVPVLTVALANTPAHMTGMLSVLVGAVDGGTTSNGKLAFFRWQGMRTGLTGSPTVGDQVYVSDTGAISLSAGTFDRQIGAVTRSGGGTFDFFINGCTQAVAINDLSGVQIVKLSSDGSAGDFLFEYLSGSDSEYTLLTAAGLAAVPTSYDPVQARRFGMLLADTTSGNLGPVIVYGIGIKPGTHGLAAGTAGYVRMNTSTGRLERATGAPGEILVGTINTNGRVRLDPPTTTNQ